MREEAAPTEIILRVRRLEKAYTVPVLRNFDFDLRRGEVHALVGSNGAGKSTFARILAGLTARDAGVITLRGESFAPASKSEASRAGITMVLQELNVLPTLTIAENLFLSRLPSRAGIIDRKALRENARSALARVGLDSLDPDSSAGKLGVGQQQLVEIAGALGEDTTSVLILDEPTAALTGPETERLFANIDRLRARGVSVLYISHRMEEIARLADRVTVLRDGRHIATHVTGKVSLPQLVREMAGSELASRRPHAGGAAVGPVALRVENLTAGTTVKGVSFRVHEGEILGIAGLVGSGRTETLRAIVGADRATGGRVTLGASGHPLKARSPADAAAAGIGLVPEDRKNDGLLLSLPITTNTTLSTLTRHARAGILDPRSETTAARETCDRLSVQRAHLGQPVASLSGGNQQKVVIARWLLHDCQVLLFDEPTRGVDVAAKETIYDCLDALATEGKALVVVSSDLTELMTVCHRIVVLSNGRDTGEFLPESWSPEALTTAAFRGYLETPA
jgi:ribose transport system ATP-binding protein